MVGTTIITTQISYDLDDEDDDVFDLRREFCGVQDEHLNDLRQMTSCIIDLQTHGKRDPFEKVTWIISHQDEKVRSFVVKRLESWAQAAQLGLQMHQEDIHFRQHLLSDSSSSSSSSSVSLSAHNHRKSSSNGIKPRPSVLSDKSNDDHLSSNPPTIIKRSNTFNVRDDDEDDLEEEAKWSNLLSDTSDFEDDHHPLMADVIIVSQLRDCLMHHIRSSKISIDDIHGVLSSPLNLSIVEQVKTMKNRSIWFCRLMLNDRIILSDGVHRSKERAEQLAYEKMVKLMKNEDGVEVKIISRGRSKVVARKCLSSKRFNETTMIETMNE